QPGGAARVDGGVTVAGHEQVDVALASFGPGFLQESAAAAVQPGDAGRGESLAGDGVHAPLVGQDEVARGQAPAVVVPQQLPVGSPGDERQGSGPQAVGDGGVGQVEDDEVGLPAGGQAGADGGPTVAEFDDEVGVALRVEGEAGACAAFALEVLVG